MRIGARGSKLSLAQAGHMQRRIAAALGADPSNPADVERVAPLIVITTTGDRIQDRRLLEIGGKGLFTKEIDDAQLAHRIDVAVHSGKDLPTTLPEGLMAAGFLPREDPRDAFISRRAATLEELPPGAVVGTASLRREALVRRLRPDLTVVLIRGNVDTRLRKVASGEVDATILAMAGLNRLGLAAEATSVLPAETFIPAVAQGAIALVIRTEDAVARAACATIVDASTTRCVTVERAFLGVLDGSCRTPIAGHARETEGLVGFEGLVLKPDGRAAYAVAGIQAAGEPPDALGARLGHEIKPRLPPDLFER